jgi:hypothetical protein
LRVALQTENQTTEFSGCTYGGTATLDDRPKTRFNTLDPVARRIARIASEREIRASLARIKTAFRFFGLAELFSSGRKFSADTSADTSS